MPAAIPHLIDLSHPHVWFEPILQALLMSHSHSTMVGHFAPPYRAIMMATSLADVSSSRTLLDLTLSSTRLLEVTQGRSKDGRIRCTIYVRQRLLNIQVCPTYGAEWRTCTASRSTTNLNVGKRTFGNSWISQAPTILGTAT
jgi:hypothetical protein